jgi:hypothetical protein
VTEALLADLSHPLWFDAPDSELALRHGVRVDEVRAAREVLRRRLVVGEVARDARELAELVEWPGSIGELVQECVQQALHRARQRGGRHTDPRSQALAEALRDERRAREMTSRLMPVSGDDGRSAGRSHGRSARTTKRAEGTSGIGIRGGPGREARAGATVAQHMGAGAAVDMREG